MKLMGIKNLGILSVGIMGLTFLIGISNLQTISSTQISHNPAPVITIPEPTISGAFIGFGISGGMFVILISFTFFVKWRTKREMLINEMKTLIKNIEEPARLLYQTGYYEKSLLMFENLTTKLAEAKEKLGKEFNLFAQSFEEAQSHYRNAKIYLALSAIKRYLGEAEAALDTGDTEQTFKCLNIAAIECKKVQRQSEEWNLRNRFIECEYLENRINNLCLVCFDNF